MKKIGITARYIYENGVCKQFVNDDYLKAINNEFLPVILPIDKNIDELLDICDCFLITGGDDLDSKWYNEPLHPKAGNVDIKMDELDKKVVDYCVKTKKPLFGICRGFQAINVFLGGSLIQHIEDESHKKIQQGVTIEIINEGMLLKNILTNETKINSYHHQGIKQLAPSLIPICKSNGLIEAFEHKYLPIFAVQWHPEKLSTPEIKNIVRKLKELTDEA